MEEKSRIIEKLRQICGAENVDDSPEGAAAYFRTGLNVDQPAVVKPADSMQLQEIVKFAAEMNFPFPYLYDEAQQTARAYGAVCTPDFFGFNAALELQYRGRLDASGRQPAPPSARRELVEAMEAIAVTGNGPAEQVASIGCSIKWRE